MVLIVAAIGKSGSGKTTTIEYLINQFSVEGYKVGAIKHIHHKGFTIDTENKNSWRYAKAGAKIVAAISPDEIAIIKKVSQETNSLEMVIEIMKRECLDIIFIEGYHDLVAKRVDVTKIVVTKDDSMLQDVLCKTVEPIIAVSGLIAENLKVSTIQGYPVINIVKDGKKLVELIKQQLVIQKGSGN
ncbi:MAG: molybdopterin-guanine dinucleotide biosynthesis protein B [Nitrososphaerota archaeon]|jgi:molybdopterin-guanine dinucleotide biosynthesis protein B|nr:molybdopterin-guanine dinucleotide biosynthesis protein B [Nitrososphaerota archaeon]